MNMRTFVIQHCVGSGSEQDKQDKLLKLCLVVCLVPKQILTWAYECYKTNKTRKAYRVRKARLGRWRSYLRTPNQVF